MDAATKEQLAKQLEQMKQKLEAAAQAHQQAMEDLKKQIEQAKERRQPRQSGRFAKKLDQLQKKQAANGQAAASSPSRWANAQQCLKQGDGKKAADAMAQMAKQLDKMQQDANEMEMLDAAMDQVEMAKDAMACKFCNGEGCEHCMGNYGQQQRQEIQTANRARAWAKASALANGPRKGTPRTCATHKSAQNPQRGAATFGGLGRRTEYQRRSRPKHQGRNGHARAPSLPTRSPASACPIAAANTPSSTSNCCAMANRRPAEIARLPKLLLGRRLYVPVMARCRRLDNLTAGGVDW